ncbi:Rieske 2Fe-2S domain-containing protein [Marinactinospora thermotolerans]|nr:Rieske (2Fe-2S) protein [Marinactinospora thermotolerans]
MRLGERIHRIERATGLDRAVTAMQRVTDRIPEGGVRDVLHGVQLGHPLHPLLVQVPIGAWLSAAVLDFTPGSERAARRLVDVGLVASLPAALAGSTDWSQQQQRHKRVGVVHAGLNTVATMLYGASSLARHSGRHGLGKALGMAGLGVVSVSGLLGAHISYALSGGANHADHVPDRIPDGWHDIGTLSEFPEGRPVHGVLGDIPLVIVRTGSDVHVMADECVHMGGPLSQGEYADGCVTCPWHGSTFRVTDGSVVNGPATTSQPVLRTRVRDGIVSVRRADAGVAVPAQRAEEAAAEKTRAKGSARG